MEAEPGPAPGPALSAALWSRIAGIYGAILEHPFIAGLTDGSLPRGRFRFYLIQDAHYLREYARALALCAAKAPAEPEIAMFGRHAADAVEVERALHETVFRELGVRREELRATRMAPTTLAYTSYLLAAAHGGSFAEALGAVLPCYWIYREIGAALAGRGSPDPLYRRWIEGYGGEDFAAVVGPVIALTDRLGPRLSVDERRRMAERFETTSRYEWMFWDAGWRREDWPV
jgi:thiaminase/transcriptional activator TenA